MKHLRITARVDPEQAPEFFGLLANSSTIDETRVLDVTRTSGGVENILFAIDGNPAAFAKRCPAMPGIESVDVTEVRENRAYALVVMRPQDTPLFGALHQASSSHGLVVRTPIVYRDSEMRGTVVGRPDTLQYALDDVPDAIDIQVEEIRQFRGELDDKTASLSDRQRETVETALDMGYYEHPREVTHEDIGDELDCASATVSDHLQKAEAKLVRGGMDELTSFD